MPSQRISGDWMQASATMASFSGNEIGSRIQIIIGYSFWWPKHTALRLEIPGRPALFWDPGGGYGIDPDYSRALKGIYRTNDLILHGAPDIATYLPFRWYTGDTLVEIFEWRISEKEALRMRHVLMAGANVDPDPQIDFDTETFSLSCASAVSKFLHRFGAPYIQIDTIPILPGRLSRELYQQRPDRVLVFYHREQPKMRIMTRSPGMRIAEHLSSKGQGATTTAVESALTP